MVKKPEANIIKLPNISASVPQLVAVINELQDKGYAIPSYPDFPTNDESKQVKLFDALKGSAVNPVLREGNSDRRAATPVKNYAMANPHSMGVWAADSKTYVSTMSEGDFAHNEKSITTKEATSISIVHISENGVKTVLKEQLTLLRRRNY